MSLKLKEKVIRRINASVQKSGMSKETKIFAENTVLAMDISKKLAELVSESGASYAQLMQLNEKMHQIWEELQK